MLLFIRNITYCTFRACFFIGAISSCYNITVFWDNFYVWDITLHGIGIVRCPFYSRPVGQC